MAIKFNKTSYQNTAGIGAQELLTWLTAFLADEDDKDIPINAGIESDNTAEFALTKVEYSGYGDGSIVFYFEDFVPNYEKMADGLCVNCGSDNLVYKDSDTLFQRKILCKHCGKIF